MLRSDVWMTQHVRFVHSQGQNFLTVLCQRHFNGGREAIAPSDSLLNFGANIYATPFSVHEVPQEAFVLSQKSEQ
jgi:hypothetical protein